ncbi:MAG: response regulator, partial [Actinomycetota bacterium]|nr:response regulator [Actinomycetota bacterium]
DLTRTITVDAAGEMEELKDTINQMIANLSETTTRNEEQDWLKSNLARIGAMLQGHRDLRAVSRLIMSELTPLVGAQHGAFYMGEAGDSREPVYRLMAGYGFRARKTTPTEYAVGEGLVGQAALEKKTILVGNVPKTSLRISTGLGDGAPVNIVVLPVLFEEQCLAVLELASFRPFSEINQSFLEQIVETVGVVLNTIIATMRTEELLEQSQSLGSELQSRQQELQHTNAELEEKALELARQNRAIEVKNAEIELARRELEERAEQLALSSKYKSEFLANMSHELRTPLNSLLILAKLLADNPEGNLTPKQVEFARSVRDAGHDLLNLISDILDLSKVEAGRLDVAMAPVRISDLCSELSQTFRPIADQASLDFTLELAEDLPDTLTTDGHRVQQILKNLLSNAFKFTEEGSVTLRVDKAKSGTRFFNHLLEGTPDVIAFSVSDTGIGIESDKLLVIFEAFQQAEGTTTRRYGGTGLGLSISREIARLLGGEIQVVSEPGKGSTFMLLLPALGSHERLAAVVPAPSTPGETLVVDEASDAGGYASLAGSRIVIVDDDVRNVYALTSALEDRGVEVLTAEDGRQGIEVLQKTPGVDLVLMDIMMPEMDGYETTRAIRKMPGFKDLPIIALTAKAMRGDREKSLAAGASDYITKPVEINQLLALMRLWLER